MTIRKKGAKIVNTDFTPGRKKVILNATYVREDKLTDALANLYQMMRMENDGYWSVLREQ
jgi:hypothetical protein